MNTVMARLLSSLDFSMNMTTSDSDWKNWYTGNPTDVVSGTTMSYFSSSVNSVTNSSLKS